MKFGHFKKKPGQFKKKQGHFKKKPGQLKNNLGHFKKQKQLVFLVYMVSKFQTQSDSKCCRTFLARQYFISIHRGL